MLDNNALSTLNRLDGKREVLQDEKRNLLHKLDNHEQVVSHEKDAYEVLEHMQESMAQNSVALYSELLTAIVRDVMGEQGTEIQLEPSMHGNRPALNIYGINDGEKEDIVESQGGSINNLLSAGFRFIALALSSERRFVVLDESDCWLSVDLVPRFIEVLDRLCDEMGVQAIFISHHSQASEVPVYKLQLSDGGEGIDVTVSAGEKSGGRDKQFNAEMLEGVAIKQMRLTNYMSHAETTLPLNSGLTTIVGPNNLGKSVITRAFSDLMVNNRLNSRIRHKQNVASVSLTLEDNIELLWSLARAKSGKPAATYSIKSEDGETLELEEGCTGVPPFVTDYLQMTSSGDTIDPHISHQKDPLFVLNPAISQYKRAEIVDLGSDYETVAKAVKKHRELILESKREIKRCKTQLDTINAELQRLSGIDSALLLSEKTELWRGKATKAEAGRDTIGQLLMIDNDIRSNKTQWSLLRSADAVLDEKETYSDTLSAKESLILMFEKSVKDFDSNSTVEALKRASNNTVHQDRLTAIDHQLALLSQLSIAQVESQKLVFDTAMQVTRTADKDAVAIHKKMTLLLALLDTQSEIEKEKSERRSIDNEISRINAKLDMTLKQSNGKCPLCHQQTTSAHSH